MIRISVPFSDVRDMGVVFSLSSRVCVRVCMCVSYKMGVRNGNDLSRDTQQFGLGLFLFLPAFSKDSRTVACASWRLAACR